MAATIQTIHKPTRARGLDTSTSVHTSSDMVTNGSFASNITGWTAVSLGDGETAPAFDANDGVGSSGCCIIDVEDGGFIGINQNLTFVAGGTYKVTLSAKAASGDSGKVIRVQDMASGVDNNMADGTHRYTLSESHQTFSTTWTATSDSTGIYIVRDTGTDADWEFFVDNIVVTRMESFGNNNHGQIYSGRALEFDGVTDYFQHNGGTALTGVNSFATGVAWTFATWIKVTNSNTANFFIGDGSSAGPHLIIQSTYVDFRASSGGSDYFRFSTTPTSSPSDGIKIENYEWYRFVVVASTSNTLTLYLNGVEAGTIIPTTIGFDDGNAFLADGGTAMEFTYWGKSYPTDHHLDGCMSDAQVWDKAWTADDVTYDYLNPEQLALNNGGTSLTNSNLKIWYPMNEGHRGNQSYVLDSSNTGLGDDVLSGYGTFTDASKWTITDTSSNDEITIDTSAQTMRINCVDNYLAADFHDTTILEVGQTYKVTVEITQSNSGSIRIVPRSGGANQSSYNNINTVGIHEFYYSSAEKTSIAIARNGTPTDITIKNLTVEAVNAKHNATTLFFGDEQIQHTTDRTFAGASNWANAAGDNAFDQYDETTGGVLTIEAPDTENRQYATLDGVFWEDDDGDGPDMVVGRTYRLSYNLTISSYAAGTMNVGFSNDSYALQSVSSYTANRSAAIANLDFIYTANHTKIIVEAAVNSEFEAVLDNFSLKEIGTATGWIDADQQLDIPQPALQSYNQLAWFEQFDETVIIADTTNDNDNIFDGGGTISAWIYPNNVGENNFGRIVDKSNATNGSNGYHLALSAESGTTSNIQFARGHDTTNGNWSFDARYITYGKWQHIVVVYNDDAVGNNPIIYLNGESMTLSETATPVGNEESDASHALTIGNRSGATDRTFSGCITEVSMWTTELSATKVTELYNSGLALDATTHSDSSNLKGYWRNNGLAVWQDLTSYNNDGTPTNITETMLITAGADSLRDSQGFLMNRQRDTNCYNAPSSSEDAYYVEVKNSDTLKITGDNITMEAWVKLDLVGDNYTRIMDLATGANSTNGYGMYVHDDGKVHVGAGGTSASESGTSVTVGNWHHLVCTTDGTNEKIYVDGALVLTASGGNTPAATTSDLWIGNSPALDDRHVNGQIDDVRIYDKAFTLTEVTRNYNAGKRSHR